MISGVERVEWNIVAECISLVILAIIWVYARKGSHLPTFKNRAFQWCLMMTFFAIFTNILSTIMIYHYQEIPLWLTELVTSIYFVFTPLMGMTYYFYTVSVIYNDYLEVKKLIIIGSIPALLYMGMVCVNPWTNHLFNMTSTEGYVRGPLIFVTYLIFYLYCIASILVTILSSKRIDYSIYKILSAFPVLAVFVIMIQQFYPNVILSGSAATCALLIIYLHLQNKQISLDYLTGIPNRQELLNMLGLLIKRDTKENFVLLVVSLRDFRQINNTYGQQKGDAFLKIVSHFLEEVGPHENVYRFSGDEFALLFTKPVEKDIQECIQVIQERMKQPWKIDDYSIHLSAIIGIIDHHNDDETLEQIIDAIEYAVHQAKTGKSGNICYCNQDMLHELKRKRQIIDILKECIAKQSFEMYYQPIYALETKRFEYAESLMRIPNSSIGPIYPSEFIPIAEETGLIVDLTYLALRKVCCFIQELEEKELSIKSIHVNFSAIQFSQPHLDKMVLSIIQEYNIPPSAIKIEFTESTLAESRETVTKFASEMMDHGIKMGLDDFGTGYSNIATVIDIPFGTLKLDKSLVYASMNNGKSATTIKNLTYTFKQLGMKILAEGVETLEQNNLMIELGVDQIQGFYYAKPLSKDDMITFLIENRKE